LSKIERWYIANGYKVKRPTISNVGGVQTIVWAFGQTFSGRLRDLAGNEVVVNEKKGYTTTHRIYCAVTVDMKETDVIYDVGSGLYYEVVIIRNPMKLNDHYEIDLEFHRDKQSSYT